MRYLMIALQVEVKKTFRSYMLKIMFVIFTLAALLAAFFIYILMDPDMARNTGMLGTYIDLYGGANWEIYVTFFKEIISIGGIIAFGFVLSWLFGREYSDGTMTDLLALRSEEHTSELQSRGHLVCRLLLEKKKRIHSSIYA